MLLERSVICFDCKEVLHEIENAPPEQRSDCPQCGSRVRAVYMVTSGYIRSPDDLQLDFAGAGSREDGRPLAAAPAGYRQLVIVQREFVADRDLFIEHVEDESNGKVLWHLESSLARTQAS